MKNETRNRAILIAVIIGLSVLAVSVFAHNQPSNYFNQNGFGMMDGMMGNSGMHGNTMKKEGMHTGHMKMMMGNMMSNGKMNCPMMNELEDENLEIQTITGIVSEIEMHKIVLTSSETESEIHIPPWFVQNLEIKEGDSVTAKGYIIQMHGDEELIPFELTINGKTFGSVEEKNPVWMQ